MNVVILAVSQKWREEEIYRAALRKLHDANPLAELRVTARLSGSGKEAREFAEVLGFKIVEFANTPGRQTAMVSGRHYLVDRPTYVGLEIVGPPADLMLGFWCGAADNVASLYKHYLIAGQGEKKLALYREKWTKSKYKDSEFKGIERAATIRRNNRWVLSPWKSIPKS